MTIQEKNKQMEQMERNKSRIKHVISLIIIGFFIIMFINVIYVIYKYVKGDVSTEKLLWLILIFPIIAFLIILWQSYKNMEKMVNIYIENVKRKLEIAETYHLRTNERVEIIRSDEENYNSTNYNTQKSTIKFYARLILKDEVEGIEIVIMDSDGELLIEPEIVDNFCYFQAIYKPKT